MKFEVVSVPRRLPWPWWAMCLVLLWSALVGAVTHMSGRAGRQIVICQFKRLTGFACPTCGSGRGIMYALRGDLAGAWLQNPLVFTILAVFLASLLLRLSAGRRVRLRLTPAERIAAWIAAVVLILVNWAYVIVYVG